MPQRARGPRRKWVGSVHEEWDPSVRWESMWMGDTGRLLGALLRIVAAGCRIVRDSALEGWFDNGRLGLYSD
jgi:hypothetical protein